MSDITAEAFKAAYERATTEQRGVLNAAWTNKTTYTDYVKSTLTPCIAKLLGCDIAYEHHRIDIVLTKPQIYPNHVLHESDVLVAIEHENVFGRSEGGITKLLRYPASLGVLTTFLRFGLMKTSSFRNQQGGLGRVYSARVGHYALSPLQNRLTFTLRNLH